MAKKTPQKKTLKKRIQNGIRKIRVIKKKAIRKKISSSRTPSISKGKVKKSVPVKERPSLVVSRSVIPQPEKEKVEVSKFTTVVDSVQAREQYNLPLRYYDDRLIALSRDPWWVHFYWDISDQRINEVVAEISLNQRQDLKWVLRVYDVTGIGDFNGNNANSYSDTGVNFDSNNWYVNVSNPERAWCGEIGLMTKAGQFFAVARSNTVNTPCFGISDLIDEQWTCADDDYYKVLGIYDLGRSSLERKKKIEKVLKEQISSAAFSGGVSSLFSYQPQQKQKKFFLEVWTELILYGRTESTAAVSVCGKKIKLKDDGTFSFRYALPEGDFRFDVVATSQNKENTLKKTPAVKRYSVK